jgi:hypothetical protein
MVCGIDGQHLHEGAFGHRPLPHAVCQLPECVVQFRPLQRGRQQAYCFQVFTQGSVKLTGLFVTLRQALMRFKIVRIQAYGLSIGLDGLYGLFA